MWLDPEAEARYSEKLSLDLSTVVPSISGPKRPQDRIVLAESKAKYAAAIPTYTEDVAKAVPVTLADGTSFELKNGAVTVAAITSCTNTSNPSVMLGAALVAKKAYDLGLKPKPVSYTHLDVYKRQE